MLTFGRNVHILVPPRVPPFSPRLPTAMDPPPLGWLKSGIYLARNFVTFFDHFEGPRPPKMEPKCDILATFRGAGFEHRFWSLFVDLFYPKVELFGTSDPQK